MDGPSDIPRLIGDLIREGVVVSRAGARCRVAIGDIVTGPIPWLATRAGTAIVWAPPAIGEQVMVLCGEGDMARGVIIGSIYSDRHPAPADDDSMRLAFADGTLIQYDPADRHLDATVSGGSATIAADDIRLTGRVTIMGDVEVSGTLTAGTDVIGGGKSLKSHTHTAVQPGQGFSGPPR